MRISLELERELVSNDLAVFQLLIVKESFLFLPLPKFSLDDSFRLLYLKDDPRTSILLEVASICAITHYQLSAAFLLPLTVGAALSYSQKLSV